MSIWSGGNQGTDGGWGPSWKVYNKTTDMLNPGPSRTITLLEEREDSINDGFFVISMEGYPNLGSTTMIDFPASYHGGAAGFFSSELRPIIAVALVSMAEDIRTHALQALHGVGRAAYDRVLLAWQEKFLMIENVLFGLEKQVENLVDHPSLQDEIRAFIRGCEYGLTRLGPPVALEAIHKAKEHFVGRHKEKILQR